MAASDFTWTPKIVVPQTPQIRDIKNEFEVGQPEYVLLDKHPANELYELTFKVLTAEEVAAIQDHFKERGGRVSPFWWVTVPAWLRGGEDMMVHYESLGSPTAHAWRYYTLRVVFRRA